MKKHFLILLLLAIFSCAKKNIPVTQQKQENHADYAEDLTEFRAMLEPKDVKTEVESTGSNQAVAMTIEPLYVNDKIDAILDRKAEKNKATKYANGFRVQLYVGRDRKSVDDAKVYIYQTYPNINPYLTYSLPIYKLKVGDFLTKADAERFLNQVKDSYPDAIIISEIIDVKKSFMK
jgi:SPOR domain